MQKHYIFVHEFTFTNKDVGGSHKLRDDIRKKIEYQLTNLKRKMLINYKYKKGVSQFVKNVCNSRMYNWKKSIVLSGISKP